MRRGIPNYDESEVEALIASYHELRAGIQFDRSGRRVARVVARLADLDKAVARLPLDYLEVVVIHGLLGIPQENAARLLEIKTHTVGKRFRRAVEEITFLMNGGI